jgi:hypothetical protein
MDNADMSTIQLPILKGLAMNLQRTSVMLVILLLISATPASAREWTSETGKFLFEAELVGANNGKVRFKRKDGETVHVNLTRLSKADRAFLATIGKAKLKIEASKQTPEEVIAALMLMGGQGDVRRNNSVPVMLYLDGTKITDAELDLSQANS